MQQAYVLTGLVADARTLRLDEALPVENGKVRVIVEVLGGQPRMTHQEFIAWLTQRQQERGYVPPSRDAVDAYLRAERESWDD